MDSSRYIGRVGALAVALGVGVAVASTPGVAWADETAPVSSDSSAPSVPSDTNRDDEPASLDAPDPSLDESLGTKQDSTRSDGQSAGEMNVGSSGGAVTSTAPGSAGAEKAEEEDADDSEDGSGGMHVESSGGAITSTTPGSTGADSGDDDVDADDSDTTEPITATEKPAGKTGSESSSPLTSKKPKRSSFATATTASGGTDPGSSRQRVASSSPKAAAQPIVSAVDEVSVQPATAPTVPEEEVSQSASTMLSWVGLSSSATGDLPSAPVESPALLALLARARKESEETLVGESSSVRNVDSTETSLMMTSAETSDSEPMMTLAAAEMGSAPEGVPTMDAPNDVTGTVTGSVNATDADGDALSYTVVDAPASGTVTVKGDGTFSYTPTAAARLAAGQTEGGDYDSFTVAVSDGQNTTPVSVTVPVSSTQMQLNQPITGLGSGPSGVAVSLDGSRMYVANSGSGSVSVIDTTTGKVVDVKPSTSTVDSIKVGSSPSALALSPDGNQLYVANTGSGTVSVIGIDPTNTATYQKVIDTNPSVAGVNSISVGSSPSALALGADGSLYVANRGSGTVSVIGTDPTNTATYQKVIDTDSNASGVNSISVGSSPSALALGADGSLYVANRGSGTVSVIGTDPTNTATYQKVIDTDSNASGVNSISVGSSPSALAVSPDGSRVYVVNSGSGTVSVIDTPTYRLVDTNPTTSTVDSIVVGSSPSSVVLSADGSLAYVANGGDTISVIDTTTNTVTRTVTIDPTAETGGHVVALGPDGRIYVTDAVDRTVRRLSVVHVNTAPQHIGVPTVLTTDTTTGAVTGSLGDNVVTDIDGDKLIFATKPGSGPATGAVTYDPVSRTFTYTPTAAARGQAADTEGEDYDHFTVTVSDGQGGTTDIPVTVTIAAAAQTDPTTIPVGQNPNGVVIGGAQGGQAYVTNVSDGTVSVIDTDTNQVVATIPVGASPTSLAASPDGATVYVVNRTANTVSVIDTTTKQVTDTVSITLPPNESGSAPQLQDVAVGADGTVYVSGSWGTISVIDPTTHEVSGPYTVAPIASGIVVSPDGSALYVATGLWNSDMMVVDTETMQVVDTVDVGGGWGYAYPKDAEFTPDGRRLYVIAGVQGEAAQTNPNPVLIIDTDPTSPTYNQVIHEIWDPDLWTPQSVAVSPDGTRAYVSDLQAHIVNVIDTTTGQVIGTITVPLAQGYGGRDIALSRDGQWLYVTDAAGDAVAVVSVDSMTSTTAL